MEAKTSPGASFKDHFSGHAGDYAACRPGYPQALFTFLASQPARRDLAWDCGTGNGQAAVHLAGRFSRVVATDASAEQIRHAAPRPGIEYRVAPAESSGLPAGEVDLVTVAQAFHWFDFENFYGEVRRVLSAGGVLAVWTYNLARVDPAVDRLTDRLARDIAGPFWPPERHWVDEEYRTIPFPPAALVELPTPTFEHVESWDLGHLLGYYATWSCCRRYQAATGVDPVKLIQDEIASAWGPARTPRPVRWPIYLRLARRPQT